MANLSPYVGVAEATWLQQTKSLIEKHPLDTCELVEIVLQSWSDIFDSKLGPKGFQIGQHIYPKPQILGFLLHELIALELSARYPDLWRGEESKADKDLVFIPDPFFSVEIKTSSNPNKIFGNRSYAQKSDSIRKKSKDGYYLTVNFGKCKKDSPKPIILLIRFGWIDHVDWIGQAAQSGQQAHLTSAAENLKLLTIYPVK